MNKTPLKRKTPLKSFTPLRAKKGLNKLSKKQRIKQDIWNQIGDRVSEKLNYMCQWCGTKGHRDNHEDLFYLGGHHLLPRRFNDYTENNYYSSHNICHGFITDNVDVGVMLNLKELYEKGNPELIRRWQLISRIYPRLEGNIA